MVRAISDRWRGKEKGTGELNEVRHICEKSEGMISYFKFNLKRDNKHKPGGSCPCLPY